MEIRHAETEDLESIEDAASRSFQTSYAISPQQIEAVVEDQFSPEALEARLGDDDRRILVAENPEEMEPDIALQGFVEFTADGTLYWLHVHPSARGRGVGTELIEYVQDELDDGERPMEARLLESASEGSQFLERFDLYWTENDAVELGGERFDVQVFSTDGAEQEPNEPVVSVPDVVTIDDETRALNEDEEVSGTLAPFYLVFETADYEEPVGFFCSQCGTTNVTADALERLECNECGNNHRSDDWDPSYL